MLIGLRASPRINNGTIVHGVSSEVSTEPQMEVRTTSLIKYKWDIALPSITLNNLKVVAILRILNMMVIKITYGLDAKSQASISLAFIEEEVKELILLINLNAACQNTPITNPHKQLTYEHL